MANVMRAHVPIGMLPSNLDWAAVDALSQRYALGVPEIDQQHRMLFSWYIALRTTPDVLQIAEGLIAYAAGHFEDEEAWAAEYGVDIAAHTHLHNELLTRLDNIQARNGHLEVVALLYDWLTTHIDTDDRALVARAMGAG